MHIRTAKMEELSQLNEIVRASLRGLSDGFYTPEQVEKLLEVLSVDSTLIHDGTYFVVEMEGELVACGGWSKRKKLVGGDPALEGGADVWLDPKADAAKIRAVFVHPKWSRRGVATEILRHAEAAARAAGFSTVELGATAPGVPFYEHHGYEHVGEYQMSLADGSKIPIPRMRRKLD